MKIHHLKTWPDFFKAVKDGTKNFEVRRNNRGFKVGDLLILDEFDPEKQEYTGESLPVQVTYVLYSYEIAYGIEPDFAVMAIRHLPQV
jgi:ASC-1-like (ASCH) protein